MGWGPRRRGAAGRAAPAIHVAAWARWRAQQHRTGTRTRQAKPTGGGVDTSPTSTEAHAVERGGERGLCLTREHVGACVGVCACADPRCLPLLPAPPARLLPPFTLLLSPSRCLPHPPGATWFRALWWTAASPPRTASTSTSTATPGCRCGVGGRQGRAGARVRVSIERRLTAYPPPPHALHTHTPCLRTLHPLTLLPPPPPPTPTPTHPRAPTSPPTTTCWWTRSASAPTASSCSPTGCATSTSAQQSEPGGLGGGGEGLGGEQRVWMDRGGAEGRGRGRERKPSRGGVDAWEGQQCGGCALTALTCVACARGGVRNHPPSSSGGAPPLQITQHAHLPHIHTQT